MTVRVGHLVFDHVRYDADSDVLYLSAGEPQPAADSDATPEGHVIRYDAAGAIVGISIVNAKWLAERDGEIAITLRVAAEELAPALAARE